MTFAALGGDSDRPLFVAGRKSRGGEVTWDWATMAASTLLSRIGVIPFAFATLTSTMARAQSASSDLVPPHSVFVHVDSPEPVELQGDTGEKRPPFFTICVSPCDTVVPADGKYRVSGDLVRPSRRFVLPEGAVHDTIVVRPASSLAFGGGIILTAVGVAAVALGALGFVFSAFSDSPDGSDNQAGRNVAIGLMLGGGAVAGGGVALMV